MRAFVAACGAVGCILLAGCETMDSIGETLGDLVPTGSEPGPAIPLWEQAPAAGGAATGALCRTATAACPLDPPLAIGAQCSCAAEGGVSLGTVVGSGE